MSKTDNKAETKDKRVETELTPEVETAKPAKKKKKVPLFSIVAVVVALALVCLLITIIAPGLVDKLFRSTPLDRGDVVMTIGDYEVTAEMYTAVALELKYQYTSYYGANFFEKNPTMERQVLDEIEHYFRSKAAYLDYANELGIEITPEAEQEIRAMVEALRDAYGDEYWQLLLDTYGLSEELLVQMEIENWIMNKVDEALSDPDGELAHSVTDEERLEVANASGLLSAKHILITGSANAAQDAQKLALAQEILQRIEDGEDFETLRLQYSEDADEYASPGDFAFWDGYGERATAYADAVYYMNIDDVSDIVLVEEDGFRGYYIIMRTIPVRDDLDSYIVSVKIQDVIAERGEALDVRYARGYKYIKLNDILSPAEIQAEQDPDAA